MSVCYHGFVLKCSEIKHLPLHHFIRFNYRYLASNTKWRVEEIIQTVWKTEDRKRLELLHESLSQHGIKSKVDKTFFDIRYYYKGKNIIITTKSVDRTTVKYCPVFYRLRCILNNEQTEKYGQAIDNIPGLAESAYQYFDRCRPDCVPGYGSTGPQNCLTRHLIM